MWKQHELLDRVETRVTNYEDAMKFYREILGLGVEMQEEGKDFAELKDGHSKTYLALLDIPKSGLPAASGFVPTFEISDLDEFIRVMKKKGVTFGAKVFEGQHARLIDFDSNNNTLRAFEWKLKKR
jgi:predicted enzyme related to lactoylglutathione lyase